ncbi:MAG TPA: Hpt domain-containing protein, partial [Geobacteraceae bacterium]|nr:Hpt domain-containing protein [Geobacteraceae bacterium]
MVMNEQHKEAFREEAYELLAELESALLELEENPDNQEMIGRTFRAMHTIKGSGAMFGFTDIAEFTHEVETVYDKVRGGLVSVDKSLIDSTLKSCDLIRAMLGDAGGADEAEIRRLKDVFMNMARSGTEDSPEKAKTGSASSPFEKRSSEKTYRIRFKPAQDIYLTGTDPILLLNELRELGECRVVAHLNEIPPLDELN